MEFIKMLDIELNEKGEVLNMKGCAKVKNIKKYGLFHASYMNDEEEV
jgi:hypothetical protein